MTDHDVNRDRLILYGTSKVSFSDVRPHSALLRLVDAVIVMLRDNGVLLDPVLFLLINEQTLFDLCGPVFRGAWNSVHDTPGGEQLFHERLAELWDRR